MTTLAAVFIGLALAVAVGDWVAAHWEIQTLEYVCKPAVMVFLIGAVLSFDKPIDSPPGGRTWLFVGALLFSLAGDVFLMLPDRHRWFVFGLASFLLGHLFFVPALWSTGVAVGGFAIGVMVVALGAATVGRTVLREVRSTRPKLLLPVSAYMAVLGLMTASAVGTLRPAVMVGGVLFFASDSMLAWNEFVRPWPLARLLVHVTYHLAQMGLILALL